MMLSQKVSSKIKNKKIKLSLNPNKFDKKEKKEKKRERNGLDLLNIKCEFKI